MRYICPIKHTKTLRVRTTQLFGANPQIYSQFKDDFGNPLKGHNGVDLTIGGFETQKSYGTDLFAVCDGEKDRIIFDSPMSTKGNGVYQWSDIEVGTDGKQRRMLIVYWHLMETEGITGKIIKLGDYVGDMGNSGWVFPAPTPQKPYDGTHLHLGFYPYILENGVWKKEFPNNGYDGAVNPLLFIGDLNPLGWEKEITLEDILNKLQPIAWAIKKLREMIDSFKK